MTLLSAVRLACLLISAVCSAYSAYDAWTRRAVNRAINKQVDEMAGNGKAQARLEKRMENALGRPPNRQAQEIIDMARENKG